MGETEEGLGGLIPYCHLPRCYQTNLPAVAPGHFFFFGHLLFSKNYLDKLPSNAHYQNALEDLAREYFQHEGCYYIDLWPVSGA